MRFDQLADARLKLLLADRADFEPEVLERAAQLVLDVEELRLPQLAAGEQHPPLLAL